MALAKALEERDCGILLFEPQQRLHRLFVSRDSRGHCLGEGLKRTAARRRDDGLPRARKGRQKARRQERALAGARGADQREEARPLQLFPDAFDLDFAAEEVLRILRCKRSQTRIGTLLLEAGRTKGDLLERVGESLSRGVASLRVRRERLAQHRRPRPIGHPRWDFAGRAPERLAGFVVRLASHGQHLGEHHPRRKHVGPSVHPLAPRLLRCHVRRGSRRSTTSSPRLALSPARSPSPPPARPG